MLSSDLSGSHLAALQARFAEALVRPDLAPLADLVDYPPAQWQRRFNVYRNTVHQGLASALAARFPVVERIVGKEYFRALALVFIERHPPSSPVLAEFGGDFAAFLKAFEPASALPYLADVARLEWLRSLAYHAADCTPIPISTLAAINRELLSNLTIDFAPSVFVTCSPFPVFSIWRTNTHDESVCQIEMVDNGEAALVTRPSLDVLVTPLAHAEVRFLEKLKCGAPLGDAFRDASSFEPPLDLSVTLARLFMSGAVSGIHASPSPL